MHGNTTQQPSKSHSVRPAVPLFDDSGGTTRSTVRVWPAHSPDGIDLIAFDGELSTATVARITPALLDWVGRTTTRRLRMDLRGVDFIDARGVTMLLSVLHFAADRNLDLRCEQPSQAVMQMFDICRLDPLLANRPVDTSRPFEPRSAAWTSDAASIGSSATQVRREGRGRAPAPVPNDPIRPVSVPSADIGTVDIGTVDIGTVDIGAVDIASTDVGSRVFLVHSLPTDDDGHSDRLNITDPPMATLARHLGEREAVWCGDCGRPSLWEHRRIRGMQALPVPLSRRDQRHAIDGFCERTLWPALHGLAGNVEQRPKWRNAFERHSSATAELLAEHADPQARIWVNDYRHVGVAAALSRVRRDLRIGLSLHTPVDAPTLGSIEKSSELAGQFAAHHFIGVQSERDAKELRSFVEQHEVQRMPTIVPVPVGIDVQRWERYRHDAEIEGIALSHSIYQGSLMIGIDRLEPTRCVPHKLLAIELLLDTAALRPDELRMVQVVMADETTSPIHRFLAEEVTAIASRINSRFARSDGLGVVELVHDELVPEQVAALMRAADVAVITPSSDGMSLDALRYSIVNADRPCDLVLSAGCAATDHLAETSDVVQGTEVLEIAGTIRRLLRKPRHDRRSMSRRRYEVARTFSVERWTRDFLAGLDDAV